MFHIHLVRVIYLFDEFSLAKKQSIECLNIRRTHSFKLIPNTMKHFQFEITVIHIIYSCTRVNSQSVSRNC